MPVLSFGSINMDLVARTSRLPLPGETLLGDTFSTAPGGKGANQAVAIARLGILTQMVGRVGADGFGQELLASLQAAGVNTDGVLVDASYHSGVAMIAVDGAGENQILVLPGANAQVDQTDVQRVQAELSTGSPEPHILLLQLEIPLPVVVAAAQIAHRCGAIAILDPAPARPDLPAELYPHLHILTPNQIEASQLVGFAVTDVPTAIQAATVLRSRGTPTVIVKLGALGVVCVTDDDPIHIPAFPVTAIDTVAAGDAFNGGLAAALVRRLPLRQALVWASAVAAIAVTRPGAQSAMPDFPTVENFLHSMGEGY